ncbi:unnamed protein product, partial [Polarella glacialis]
QHSNNNNKSNNNTCLKALTMLLNPGVLVLTSVLALPGVGSTLASWADGKWYDGPKSLNLPVTICKSPLWCPPSEGCAGHEGTCHSAWKPFSGYCYRLIDKSSEFDLAVERCKEHHNSSLVSLTSMAENAFVRQLCGNRFCWLGLRESHDSEVWEWLDGSDASYGSYANWQQGEPNNFGGSDENVALMHFNMKEYKAESSSPDSWESGTWYDVPSIFNLPYVVCEQDLQQQQQQEQQQQQQQNLESRGFESCTAGWRSFGESCYQMLDSASNYADAEQRCKELSSHLVTIGAAAEQRFVKDLCGEQMCWLGLREHSGTELWYWIDETPLAYENWQAGEPNNYGEIDENRVVMNMNIHALAADMRAWKGVDKKRPPKKSLALPGTHNAPWADGKWYDAPSYFNLPVTICKTPSPCFMSRGCTETMPKCEYGWLEFQSSCYKLIDRGSEFKQAVQRCEEQDGGSLVSIESQEENAFVQQLCGNRFCWLGLRENHDSEVWEWLDGSDASFGNYANWQQGEPNNAGGRDENVAVMHFNMKEFKAEEFLNKNWATGAWYDIPKSFNMPKAICQHLSATRVPPGCADKWTPFGDSCYRRLDWHSDAPAAEQRCQGLFSHLVTIGSAAEQAFVKGLCGEHICWLGLREHPDTELWYWIDATPLEYENWEAGEPNNYGGVDENRAVMNMNIRAWQSSRPESRSMSPGLLAGVGSLMLLFTALSAGKQLTAGWRGHLAPLQLEDPMDPISEPMMDMGEARSPNIREPTSPAQE